VHRERHAAHRLDAFGEQRVPDLGLERREVRTLEPPGRARREGDAVSFPTGGLNGGVSMLAVKLG